MRGVYAAAIVTFMTDYVMVAWQQRISRSIHKLIRIYALASDTETLCAFVPELQALCRPEQGSQWSSEKDGQQARIGWQYS